MKVLMVNKFHYIKGGSETYYFSLKRLLESKGFEVVDFSMKDAKNFDSPYREYFVDNVSYDGTMGIRKKIQAACRIVYSIEARRKFEALVQQEKPDLIHLHLFQHQLSPSILDVVKKYRIPCVYTAHDLKMICLNYKMMHHGRLCEDCKDGCLLHCVRNRCVKESFFKSCINTLEGYVHRFRKSYDAIRVIITPSAFYHQKFQAFGVEAERLVHIPNFLDQEAPSVTPGADSQGYYLYFGRLSEEKGVQTMIQAFAQLGYPLYIVGTGPMQEALARYVDAHHLSNIRFWGFQCGQDLTNLVGNAKAVILPSEWYENGPYSAIEALQLGCPVIGADIGGIPELISKNGFLFESGNAQSLAQAVSRFEALSDEQRQHMREASRQLFEQNHTKQQHFQRLMEAYGKAGLHV